MDGEWALREVRYDHPDPAFLTELAQRYYVEIYGGPDDTPFTADDFAPPHGRFLVGYLGGEPVAMGGWRLRRPGSPPMAERPAEIKRMFVRDASRGRGLARRVLEDLERTAAAAGADWMVLETGVPQRAAIAFYRAAGYGDIPDFGHYAGSPAVVSLGKVLGRAIGSDQHPG